MGGNPTQTTTQNSQSAPWAPAIPALTSLLGNVSGQSTGVTPQQMAAVQNLMTGASGIPSFAPQATNVANSLFSGGGANNQAGTVQNAYGSLQNSLSPISNPANLNPYLTPGFSDALKTMNNDITNQVNDQFASAGRTLSPGNSTALARGLSQGEGQMLANQYNTNVGNLMGASNSLFGAGLNTGNALTGYNQLGNQNMMSGTGIAGMVPGLSMAPGQAQLSAANAGYGMPFANIGTQESLLTPIAALGGQTSGTSTQETQIPLWQQILGGGMAGAGMFGSMFGGSGSSGTGPSAMANFLKMIP